MALGRYPQGFQHDINYAVLRASLSLASCLTCSACGQRSRTHTDTPEVPTSATAAVAAYDGRASCTLFNLLRSHLAFVSPAPYFSCSLPAEPGPPSSSSVPPCWLLGSSVSGCKQLKASRARAEHPFCHCSAWPPCHHGRAPAWSHHSCSLYGSLEHCSQLLQLQPRARALGKLQRGWEKGGHQLWVWTRGTAALHLVPDLGCGEESACGHPGWCSGSSLNTPPCSWGHARDLFCPRYPSAAALNSRGPLSSCTAASSPGLPRGEKLLRCAPAPSTRGRRGEER